MRNNYDRLYEINTFILRHKDVAPAWETLMPANMPVVDTLKSRYAIISGVGAL